MDILFTIFALIVLLFSVIIHELAHGYVAFSLGDPTAKYEGRLTLNPLKHLDMFGSIIIPVVLFATGSPFLFGWAKPVPVNPYNFRDQRYGEIKVSVAGPASNLLLAIVFGLVLRFLPDIFLASNPALVLALSYIVFLNIWLAVFNLIPIPPLDGSWILFGLLPHRLAYIKDALRQYGIAILLLLILFGGEFWSVVTNVLFQLITGKMLT
jgi:Zn-dependent protease